MEGLRPRLLFREATVSDEGQGVGKFLSLIRATDRLLEVPHDRKSDLHNEKYQCHLR